MIREDFPLSLHPSTQTRYIDKPAALYNLNSATKCSRIWFPSIQEKFSPAQLWLFWVSFASWSERNAPVNCRRGGSEITLRFCLELESACDGLWRRANQKNKEARYYRLVTGCIFNAGWISAEVDKICSPRCDPAADVKWADLVPCLSHALEAAVRMVVAPWLETES